MIGIDNEAHFEAHLRELIRSRIIDKHADLVLFEHKDVVDMLICRNGPDPAMFYIEIKYQKESSGRWSLGGQNGSGYQPEILRLRPEYLERNLRWILGSELYEDYYLVDNNTLMDYLQGDEIADKYNGIKKEILRSVNGISFDTLISQLEGWLLS